MNSLPSYDTFFIPLFKLWVVKIRYSYTLDFFLFRFLFHCLTNQKNYKDVKLIIVYPDYIAIHNLKVTSFTFQQLIVMTICFI